MALDEAILVESPSGSTVLRFFDWSGEACTFGYSQKYSEAKAACRPGVDPVRRATGGGIVHHDGDLTFSLVFDWDRTLAPETIYKNIHRGIHQSLKAVGVDNGLFSRSRSGSVALNCFTTPEKMDVVLGDGSKLLGGALRKKGARGLYQGSLRADKLPFSSEALKAAVQSGVTREFVAVSQDIRPEWLDAGRSLEARYRSPEWNERR